MPEQSMVWSATLASDLVVSWRIPPQSSGIGSWLSTCALIFCWRVQHSQSFLAEALSFSWDLWRVSLLVPRFLPMIPPKRVCLVSIGMLPQRGQVEVCGRTCSYPASSIHL